MPAGRMLRPSRFGRSTDPEPDLPNQLCAKTALQFPQDLGFRDLLELVMQRWLQDANKEDAVAQAHGRRMCRDKIADDLMPRFDYFRFVQTLTQAEPLHQFRQQLARRLPAVGSQFSFGQATPFGENNGAKGGIHLNLCSQ